MASLITAKDNLKGIVSFQPAALHRMIFSYIVSGISYSCSVPRKQPILHISFSHPLVPCSRGLDATRESLTPLRKRDRSRSLRKHCFYNHFPSEKSICSLGH